MVGVWYELVRVKLREASVGGVLDVREARWVLGNRCHVPRELQVSVLEELLELGIVERVSLKRLRVV